jgi:predicted phosphodiesterase
MPKAPTNRDLATAICKKFPGSPSRTLARKLYGENKQRFPNLEAARTTIRVIRGNKGSEERPKARVPRKNAKAGWKPACPPSDALPWTPVELPRPSRVLCLSDIHIPYHDQRAVNAALVWGREYKPTVVLLNGDFQDFYRQSKFQQRPEKRDLKHEIEVGQELLAHIRETFPKAKIIYKMGNHDNRWDTYVWNHAPEMWNMEQMQLHNVLGFEKLRIQRVNDEPVMAGKLPIFHGHELPKGGSPVNPARGAFMRSLTSMLIGHVHRHSTHSETNLWHKDTVTWSQGCLCDRRPEFARINKWTLGFSAIDVAKDGEFDLHNMQISNSYKVRPA